LTRLVTNWASKAVYPRPSTEVQDEVLKHVDNLISSSTEEAIRIFRERKAYLTAWQYLCSSIGRYTSSQRDVYVATGITIEALQESLERKTKKAVLMLLRETVLELALESASGDQKTGLHTLQHVVMWGLVLLEINAEPVTPRLSDKMEMHRGMASFILDQPSGVPVHEDADPDLSITGVVRSPLVILYTSLLLLLCFSKRRVRLFPIKRICNTTQIGHPQLKLDLRVLVVYCDREEMQVSPRELTRHAAQKVHSFDTACLTPTAL
jgi:hypothetical protein